MAYTWTRKALRQRIGSAEYCGDMVTGTATSGSASTLVDTSRQEPDSFGVGGEIYMTSGSAINNLRAIKTWTNSTQTLVPAVNFSAAIANTDTYEIHPRFTATDIHNAINDAIRSAGLLYPRINIDASLTLAASTFQYDVSALTVKVDPDIGIDTVEYDPVYSGLTGYNWIDIPKAHWYIYRDYSTLGTTTLKLQFNSQEWQVPRATSALRLTYRTRPPTLSADTDGLAPDTQSFADYVCAKATAFLFDQKSRQTSGEDMKMWAQMALNLHKVAEGFEALDRPQRQGGKVIFGVWGQDKGWRGVDPYNLKVDNIHIQ